MKILNIITNEVTSILGAIIRLWENGDKFQRKSYENQIKSFIEKLTEQ